MTHMRMFWFVEFDKQIISGEVIQYYKIIAPEIEYIVSMRCTLDSDNFPFLSSNE